MIFNLTFNLLYPFGEYTRQLQLGCFESTTPTITRTVQHIKVLSVDAQILSSVSMFALTDRGFACTDSDILSFSWQNRTFYLICRRYKKLKKVDRLSFSFLFFIVFLSLSQLQYSYFSTCSKPSQEWILKLKQSYKEDSQSNV